MCVAKQLIFLIHFFRVQIFNMRIFEEAMI